MSNWKEVMKNASDKVNKEYYKLGGIKRFDELINETSDNYLVFKDLDVDIKAELKDMAKILIGFSNINENKNEQEEHHIICDKKGNKKYTIEYSNGYSNKNIKLLSENGKEGYLNVKKTTDGFKDKVEQCIVRVFWKDKKIAEFIKYDNSYDINEYSDELYIDINVTRGGMNIEYSFKNSKNNIKRAEWRKVQPQKDNGYIISGILKCNDVNAEKIAILLLLARYEVDITTKNKVYKKQGQ